MTPELMAAGARAKAIHDGLLLPGKTESGGREASYSRVATGELDVTHGAILYLDDITVSFDGFKALNALSLSISAGEMRCIIGPNGAGKTTMMDVITGPTSARPSSARPSTCCACARTRSRRSASAASSRSPPCSSSSACSRTSSSR